MAWLANALIRLWTQRTQSTSP